MILRRLTLGLLIVALTTGGSACMPEQTDQVLDDGHPIDPVETALPANLPFPPDEVEQTWPLAGGRILIARRTPHIVRHYVATDDACEQITGINRARVHEIAEDAVTFICHGETDNSFISFPYHLIYYLSAGLTETRSVFLDETREVEFGGWFTDGLLLKNVALDDNRVSFAFGSDPEKLPSGLNQNIPRTTISWDEARSAFIIAFQGTVPTPDFTRQSISAPAPASLPSVHITHTGGATQAVVRLPSPRPYTAHYTFGLEPTLTVVWKAR